MTIPDDVNVVTTLPIVALKDSKNAALAQAWDAFVVAHERELVDASSASCPCDAPEAAGARRATAPPAVAVVFGRRRARRLLRAAARGLVLAGAVERRRLGARRSRRRATRCASQPRVLAVGDRRCRCCSACRSRGCSRASRFPGRGVVRALALLPLVLPPVVGGVALFYTFGRRGLIGQWLDRWFGFQLPFTIWAAILAETFVAMPFLVITVEGALRGARHALRGRGRGLRCRALDGVAAGDAADDRAVDRRRASRSRGHARSASSARRSRSPGTSRARRRRCRSRSISRSRTATRRASC